MTKNQNNFSSLRIEELLHILIELVQQGNNSTVTLPLLTQRELLGKLNISPNTLKSWELQGLRRLEPPIENCRTVFYKISDVLKFLET
ncbi:hypothetical protein [Lactococcus lactis]|uniref:hypothetical protein n=1 Tax=Lactococcus lactis TaxID=1358 RepID=UPI001F52B7ED|nr:hypothetical protein [Lactococcus lactis]MCI1071883.1 hypothetical protein [Lactococcus lactis]